VKNALLFATGAALAVTTPARAQEFKTSLRAGGEVLYDSNLLRLNHARGGSDGSDVRITPAIDIDIVRPIGRDNMALTGFVGYDFYRRNSFLNRERIRLDASSRLGLGAFCRANLSAGVDFQQTDLSDLGERVGNTTRQQSFGGTVDCSQRVGLAPTLTARRTVENNSRESRRRYDLRAYNVSGGLSYTKPDFGVVQAFYRTRHISHPFRLLTSGMLGDKTDVSEFGVGFRRASAPRLHFDVNAMWVKTRSQRREARSFSGISWDTSVDWLPSPRLSFAAKLNRSIRGESSFGAAYTIDTTSSLSAGYQLTYRTKLFVSLSKRRRVFRGEDTLAAQPARGWDDTSGVGAGATYDLHKIRLSTSVGYRHRNSGNEYYHYSSTTALFGARLLF
jgi:hypothetical protein